MFPLLCRYICTVINRPYWTVISYNIWTVFLVLFSYSESVAILVRVFLLIVFFLVFQHSPLTCCKPFIRFYNTTLNMSVISEAYNYVKLRMYNLINTLFNVINFPLMLEAFKRSAIEFASACSPELKANDWFW